MEWNYYRGEYSTTVDENNPRRLVSRAKVCNKSWVIWIEDSRSMKVSPRRVIAKPITNEEIFHIAEEMLMKFIQMYDRKVDYE
jgi:hypothetical protein